LEGYKLSYGSFLPLHCLVEEDTRLNLIDFHACGHTIEIKSTMENGISNRPIPKKHNIRNEKKMSYRYVGPKTNTF